MKKAAFSAEMSPEKAMLAIMARLRRQGAAAVITIDVGQIIVDERVRLKCQIPLCDSYGKNLMCPPYVPPVSVFSQALARYSKAILIQTKAQLSRKGAFGPTAEVWAPAKKLHELVNMAEKWAFAAHFRFATGLIGGCCRLCDECVAVANGRLCRHPFKSRPSMEAMGIDVMGTLEKAGLPIRFPVEEEVTWTGVVLV